MKWRFEKDLELNSFFYLWRIFQTNRKMIKNIIEKYGLLITIIIQLILIVVAFNKAFSNWDDYLFQNVFDGFRNYYGFEVYINQNSDWLKFTALDYPFGDYALFTDNSPSISVPLKFINTYIVDISDYVIPIYNYILISGQLWAAILSYLILKPRLNHRWLLIIASIGLAWIHPQILRPFVGHLNLGWAWLLLFSMYATQKITYATNSKTVRNWIIGLTIMLFFGAFVHLYYLLINVIFIGLWAFAWAVDKYWNDENWRKPLVYGIIPTVISLVGSFLIIRLMDNEYTERLPAQGFGYDPWELHFLSLFHSYNHNGVKFPFETLEGLNYESYAYLGGMAAFALLILLILRIVKQFKIVKPHFNVFKTSENRIFYYWIFAAGFMTIMALGNEFHAFNFKVYNYLSPFYYVKKVSDLVNHFRCIARLSWFLFWVINFGIIILIDNILSNSKSIYIKIVAIGLLVIFAMDVKDFVNYHNHQKHPNNISNEDNYTEIISISDSINTKNYQAILPIPYYHQGTEDLTHTIDAPIHWLNQTCQLQRVTNLPLMASQMGRTPHYHALELFTIFTEPEPSKVVLEKMNDKKVLVMYSKRLNKEGNNWCRNKKEPARSVAYDRKGVIEKYNMKFLFETDNYLMYEWNIEALK